MSQERATARDVILAVAENMKSSLEPLVTKTLAPSLYQVYLHAEDYERLRTIFGEIEAEAKELLDREMQRMNRGASPVVGRIFGRVRKIQGKGDETLVGTPGKLGKPAPRFVSAEGRWFIRFQEDPNGALEPGDIQVVSEFAQAPAAGYGAGSPTHRISTTRRLGRMTSQRETSDAAATAFARISYKDDSGPKEFWVTKDEVVIGREAPDVWVDLRLETSLDVSREHARLRRLPESGVFRIKDLSKLGTTVNGTPVPPSGAGEGGRDLDQWVDLPDRARIGLAGTVFLDFERTAKP
ncbi:MAG TPA: FHA domain-containing protein [Thermoanaerobaculia bacterium]|nr:FHA domain-containing protein [Thermoanaerobaculia bacterium]